MTRPRLLVLGDLIVDAYQPCSKTRRSDDGGYPTTEVGNVDPRRVYGGAANVALNAVAAGADVVFVSSAELPHESAEDRQFVAALRRRRGMACIEPTGTGVAPLVKTRYVDHVNGAVLFCTMPPRAGFYARTREVVRSVVLGMSVENNPPHQPTFDAVLIADYGAGIVDEHTVATLRRCYPGAKIFFDPHLTTDPVAWAGVDVVKINAAEAEEAQARTRRPLLAALRPVGGVLVKTAGEAPVEVYTEQGRPYRVTPPSLPRIVDSCGAGDTFFAFMAARIVMGDSLGYAVEYASCAAWLTLSHRGCFVPSAEAVAEAHRQLPSAVESAP